MANELPKWPEELRATCHEFFGTYNAKRKTWSPENRCDKCPLRAPCLRNGIAPARTLDELRTAQEVFIAEGRKILGLDPS